MISRRLYSVPGKCCLHEGSLSCVSWTTSAVIEMQESMKSIERISSTYSVPYRTVGMSSVLSLYSSALRFVKIAESLSVASFSLA